METPDEWVARVIPGSDQNRIAHQLEERDRFVALALLGFMEETDVSYRLWLRREIRAGRAPWIVWNDPTKVGA